jgi:hypothetical protein
VIESLFSEHDEDDDDDTADGKEMDMDVEKRAALNERT